MNIGNIFEILAIICGLIQGILICLNRKENWIFYILNIITFTVFSLLSKLYGDVLENILYLVLGIFGLSIWYNTNIENKYTKIEYCNTKERIKYTSLIVKKQE